jgi:hypothetical protein
VGVYLRESRRTNRDGSVVRYLQLAHNERHPQTGNPVAKVIHSFGRVEQVDRAALARLVSSIWSVPAFMDSVLGRDLADVCVP